MKIKEGISIIWTVTLLPFVTIVVAFIVGVMFFFLGFWKILLEYVEIVRYKIWLFKQ